MNQAEALLQAASDSDLNILRRPDLGLECLLVSVGLLKDLVGPTFILLGSTPK